MNDQNFQFFFVFDHLKQEKHPKVSDSFPVNNGLFQLCYRCMDTSEAIFFIKSRGAGLPSPTEGENQALVEAISFCGEHPGPRFEDKFRSANQMDGISKAGRDIMAAN